MRTQIAVDDAVQTYVERSSRREPTILRQLREETSVLPAALMQVPPEQGQFLRLLLAAVGARRTVEVGVFTGYSLVSTALTLPHDGTVVALELHETWGELAMHYCRAAGVGHKVDLRVGQAADNLAAMVADEAAVGSFDFGFIDADKENYRVYFEHLLALLRPGGLLVIDNVLWHGTVVDPATTDPETRALREFNDALHHDERIDLSMVPLADGMTLAVKR